MDPTNDDAFIAELRRKTRCAPSSRRFVMAGSGTALLGVAGLCAVLLPAEPAPAVLPGQAYRLVNVVTGKCATFPTGKHSDETVLQETCLAGGDQQFQLQPTRNVNGTQLYWIRDIGGSQFCLDVPKAGIEPAETYLAAHECVTPAQTDNQEWTLRDTGDHAQYAVVNAVSGLCLDVYGHAYDNGDLPDGRPLMIYPCTTADAGWDDHQWTFR